MTENQTGNDLPMNHNDSGVTTVRSTSLNDREASSLVPLLEGRFTGIHEFAESVRSAIAHAAQEGWREVICCDASFEDWPLREKGVVDALQSWAHSGRRLTLIARGYSLMQRNQPRFVTWRKRWDHLIDCRLCKHIDSSDFPSVLWAPQWFMRRLDLVRSTGVASVEPARCAQTKEMLLELYKQSSVGFSATTLGL